MLSNYKNGIHPKTDNDYFREAVGLINNASPDDTIKGLTILEKEAINIGLDKKNDAKKTALQQATTLCKKGDPESLKSGFEILKALDGFGDSSNKLNNYRNKYEALIQKEKEETILKEEKNRRKSKEDPDSISSTRSYFCSSHCSVNLHTWKSNESQKV